MEILSIKLKSKRNPNVFVCDTESGEFELHSDIIVKNNLSAGLVDDNLFYVSVQESAEIIAFNLCVKYISSRVKTEKQIKDYLYKKEYKTDIVNAVIKKLKEYNIINDEMFAESYIKSNTNYSKNKIKQKLYSFGVKSGSVDILTEEVDDYASCLNNAKKYMKNKVYSKEVVDKLIRRLQGMGYNWDAIKHALNELKCEVED